jgi:hypothetical protein
MEIKTAAKTKYVEYFLSTKTFLKYHLFLSTLVSDMFCFLFSFVSSKAQTVHLYSLK